METQVAESKPKLPQDQKEFKAGKFVTVKGKVMFEESITVRKLNRFSRKWEIIATKKTTRSVEEFGFMKELKLEIVFRKRLTKDDQAVPVASHLFFKRNVVITVNKGRGFQNVYLIREKNAVPMLRHFGIVTTEAQLTNVQNPIRRSNYTTVTETEWEKITQAEAQKLVNNNALFCTWIANMPDGSTDYRWQANMKFAI